MHELPARLARLDAQYLLNLGQCQLTQLAHALHPVHNVLHVLCGDAWQRTQQLLGGRVHTRPRVRVFLRTDQYCLGGVGLSSVRLEVVEDLCGRVGRGGPYDADARKSEGEEDELGLDGLRRGRRGVGARVSLLLRGVLVGLRVRLDVCNGLRGSQSSMIRWKGTGAE